MIIKTYILALSIIGISFLPWSSPIAELQSPSYQTVTISETEQELYDLIMAYRSSKGLPSIPLSSSLTYVAQTHSRDLADNRPDKRERCNGHSWSESTEWSGCCYTSDHKQAQCMWDKPRELTDYEGDGFEIAYSSMSSDQDYRMTPEAALDGWKKSTGHNNVIINRSTWKDIKWKAIGVGMYKGMATVWFGMEIDQATPPICPTK